MFLANGTQKQLKLHLVARENWFNCHLMKFLISFYSYCMKLNCYFQFTIGGFQKEEVICNYDNGWDCDVSSCK